MVFKDIITALITPFKDNKIDFDSLEILIEKQISAGIKSIVIGGSTGEGSSLSDDEYYSLIAESVRISSNRINIIAGITGVYTQHVCSKIEKLLILNVNGLMCTVPHYVKPEQDGLVKHFTALNNISIVPIMLYAHPGRTGCSISDDTLIKLSHLENITALKDATSSVDTPLRLHNQIGNNFNFLVGDDTLLLAYSANGGAGCVSVISNAMPKTMNKINSYCSENNFSEARKILQEIMPIILASSRESNPIGIKALLNTLGLTSDEIRLPLTKASKTTTDIMKSLIKKLYKIENNG